jgi:hypothetical protein
MDGGCSMMICLDVLPKVGRDFGLSSKRLKQSGLML